MTMAIGAISRQIIPNTKWSDDIGQGRAGFKPDYRPRLCSVKYIALSLLEVRGQPHGFFFSSRLALHGS